MAQAAAFLNGLFGGYERTSAIQRNNRNDERQAKLDQENDLQLAKKKKYEKSLSELDPMQDVNDRYAAATAEWQAKQQQAEKENQARQAVESLQQDSVNPAAKENPARQAVESLPQDSVNPAANGISFAQPPVQQMQQPDALQTPPSGPVNKAVSMGIPMAMNPQANAIPRPEKEQPTMADSLNYKSRILDLKRKNGMDVSNDLVELSGLRKKMDDEGLTHAYALLNAGRYEDAEKAFNSVGNSKGWKLEGAPIEKTIKIDGQEMPTKIATFIMPNGEKRVINSARDMSAMMNIENQIKYGQEGSKISEASRHNKATEENNADKIAMLQAKIDAKQLKGDDLLKQVKDAADKYGIAYGIKTDTLGNLIMPPDLSSESKKQYFTGLEQLQGLIQLGAPSYAAVNSLYKNQSEEMARAKVAGKATVNPASAGIAQPQPKAAPQPGYSVSASVKIPESLPKGLVVGATTKQPDGEYSTHGKTVTIAGGKITEIK